jgi:hypothetical protein
LETTAGLEHTSHLREGSMLIGHEVKHPVGDDDICPVVEHRQALA